MALSFERYWDAELANKWQEIRPDYEAKILAATSDEDFLAS
ncbi:MAG: hypothetical protein R2880_18155 [Deinococcales bacterium]